jgi:hypothetical protein
MLDKEADECSVAVVGGEHELVIISLIGRTRFSQKGFSHAIICKTRDVIQEFEKYSVMISSCPKLSFRWRTKTDMILEG